jgi:hypothetical protein
MKAPEHRKQFQRSGDYLRRCRRRYVRRAYNVLMDESLPVADRNEVIERMAKKMATSGLYSHPKSYDPEKHPSPRNVRQGIGNYLGREWRRREDEKSIAKHGRPRSFFGTWPWHAFCRETGWSAWDGRLSSLKIVQSA